MTLSSPIYQLKRRAKSMARQNRIPLSQALDTVAQSEGFATWSLLVSKQVKSLGSDFLSQVEFGQLALIAARAGHGKTLVGFEALLDARRKGAEAFFFTLEMTREEAQQGLSAMGSTDLAKSVAVETSDDIDAEFIIAALKSVSPGAVVVVDYLQRLDERRDKRLLSQQLDMLQSFAREKGIAIIFIAQIDRAFDAEHSDVPSALDVRLSNPFSMDVFKKRLFLHEGKTRVEDRFA